MKARARSGQGERMVKSELIAELARRHPELKAEDVERIARLVLEAMTEALAAGEGIELRGFGAFRVRRYGARQARNPGTGETIDLKERGAILFKVGAPFRARLDRE
jgi:integration host factor subunit beta